MPLQTVPRHYLTNQCPCTQHLCAVLVLCDRTKPAFIGSQDAHATAKASRVGLGVTLQDVKANLRVAQRTKKKQGWEALLAKLTQLREASHLHDKLK